MTHRTIRATETLARDVIDGQIQEVLGYINPTNDGRLAAWMTALDRAQRMVATIQVVVDAISARPMLTTAQKAWKADCEALAEMLDQMAGVRVIHSQQELDELMTRKQA